MITFGGRPLNTYKGGGKGQSPQPASKTVTPEFTTPASKTVTPEFTTPVFITKPPLARSKDMTKPVVVEVSPDSVTIDRPGTFDLTNDMTKPVVVEVSPDTVTIDRPGTFDPTNNESNNESNNSPDKKNLLSGGSPKELLNLNNAIEKAKFNNKLIVKILGAPIVSIFIFLFTVFGYLWNLIIIMILFSICYFIHEITQGFLDASHLLLDGVSYALTDMYKNGSINFGFMGFPNAKIDLFGYMAPWIRDVDRSNEKFPREAGNLVVNVLTEMLKSIVEALPGIFEGISDGFEKIIENAF